MRVQPPLGKLVPEAKSPPGEEERLAALHEMDILDTPPEAQFDAVAELAAHICRTPMSLVTLVDRDRQWFKARVNFPVPESERAISFCAHAILDPETVMIVEDATADARFADNPLVVGDPRIRFYAGAPLVTRDGQPLGTLCVLDHEARTMEPAQTAALAALAREVSVELDLRRHLRRLGNVLKAHEAAKAELAETQLALEERIRQLTLASHELEAFSYAASHDLRAPLRAIAQLSALLEESSGGKLDDTGRAMLRRIGESGQRLSALVEGLLTLAHVTHKDLLHERVDLGAIAEDVVEELRVLAPERKVAVEIENGLLVDGDPRLLRTLLENLLRNAWKFTSRVPDARVKVGRSFEDALALGEPVIYVEDNGAGFPQAQAARLFRPFERLHGQGEFAGSGIGLATVKRIVDRHGGSIAAVGEPGKGARFSFILPAPPPRPQERVASSARGR